MTADRVKVGGDNMAKMKSVGKQKDRSFIDVTFPNNLSMLIWDGFDDYAGLAPKSKLERKVEFVRLSEDPMLMDA